MRDVATAHAGLLAANDALRSEIATREAAEAQVRQMQKMEAVGQLTGGIAHDFNNMLAVIMSAMNLIQRKLARGETDIGKFVDAATDATTRAANLTARLLAFSRQQPLAPQVIDANRVVTGMSDLLRRTLGETISRSRRCWPAACGGPTPIRASSRTPSSTSRSTAATPCPTAAA